MAKREKMHKLIDGLTLREPHPEFANEAPKDVDLEKDVKRPENPAGTGRRNGRILVVDDDAPTCEMLLKALSLIGYEAFAAHSGPEAIDMFVRGIFDLVITDLQMPGMTGWKLACRIKERFPGTPVILMTALAKKHVMKDMEKSSVDSALFKPFSLAELEHEIQSILKGTSQEKSH